MPSSAIEQANIVDTLDIALFAFALMPPTSSESHTASMYRDLMFARTTREGLRRAADRDSVFAAQRLRLALQLAPLQAIQYETTNPQARWQIVHRHLASRYPLTPDDLLIQLARRIAVTLSDWQEPRGATTAHRRTVWTRSNGRCSACHYDFNAKSSPALAKFDPFKPYERSPEELTSEEIDHIVAISGVGTNESSNLQLLCRWCNFGKGDGLGVDIRREAEYAAVEVSEAPRGHVASMFYMTLAANDFSCEECESGPAVEITARTRDRDHGFLLSNMKATCYDCAQP